MSVDYQTVSTVQVTPLMVIDGHVFEVDKTNLQKTHLTSLTIKQSLTGSRCNYLQYKRVLQESEQKHFFLRLILTMTVFYIPTN